MLILCAGLLPGAQIAERAGGLSPSWPGPRCARPRAHAPGTQRPAPLRVRRARAHRSPRLRAARDTHRARLFPWQARDGRDRKRRGCGAGGPGLHARARVKPAGASARRLCSGYVYSYVNSLTHTQTHGPRGGKCPGVDHRPAWGRGGGGRMDERRRIWRERRYHGVREGRGERALPGVPGRRTSGARGAMEAARREALGGAQTPKTCQDATSRSAVRGGQRGR